MSLTKTPTFTVTDDHLALAQAMWVIWEEGETGAPCVDTKRPYGNSDVERDIAEILEWDLEDGELSEEQYARATDLHLEMQTVLQIALATLTFKAGEYRQVDPYNRTTWEGV